MKRATWHLGLEIALFCWLTASAFAQPAPSANKGRAGTYSVDTDVPNYKYFVCVPSTYDGKRPAGIHLFFHGQNSQNYASSFDHWSKTFLEPFNLIGINMQYNDGDNYKDTENKVRVAIRAVMQVRADYKVLPVGAVASMSGGGQTLGLLFTAHGKPKTREPFWPFQHCSIYSSNFRVDARGGFPMSWFIGLGGKEWNMYSIGQSQTARAAELFADTTRGGCPDIYLRIDPDRGHTVSDGDVAASAAMYARSSIAFTPFLYPADYSERELQPIVRSCNELALGKANQALKSLLARQTIKAELKEKAEDLQSQLDERVDAVLRLAHQLSQDDPVLFTYYSTLFTQQLLGHPRAKELAVLVADAKKDKGHGKVAASWGNFIHGFPNLFSSKPDLNSGAATCLEKVKGSTPENSLLGRMATEFLNLK